MPKRSRKNPAVEAIPSGAIIQESQPDTEPTPVAEKNPAAVALGKLGGKKGGPARAAKLTKEQRSTIAKKAAAARWKKKDA